MSAENIDKLSDFVYSEELSQCDAVVLNKSDFLPVHKESVEEVEIVEHLHLIRAPIQEYIPIANLNHPMMLPFLWNLSSLFDKC